jgi:hypothetical protein
MGRRMLTTVEEYSHALKKGKGRGAGATYEPWLRVNDVSSHGKSTKIHGIKTDRTHHLLSENEHRFFLCAEFNQRVIDIREQFPLFPVDMVVRVAREAGIEYPLHKKSQDPTVLTTDFLLTLKNQENHSYLAIAVKPEEKLRESGVLERLEIERLWWETMGVPWRLVIDNQLDRKIAQNLGWISDPLRGRKALELGDRKDELIARLVDQIEPGDYEYTGLVEALAKSIKTDSSLTGRLIRASIWYHFIDIDLSTPIQEQSAVRIKQVSSAAGMNSEYGAVNS